MNKISDLGNNESVAQGIFPEGDGWEVLTATRSRYFKTLAGAIRCAKKWGVYFGN